ncbi:MAG: FAD-dependent oxidoreductase [Deltaproteobacteria bacterium]|nr:FAD-dependent oxidoreductase [Deltaproteobacteria bacterium]
MAVVGRTHRPVVDPEICQQCGICVRECPAEGMADFRHDRDTVRGFVYTEKRLFAHKSLPPCTEACPLGQKVRDYVRLLHRGRVREALLIIREDNPLPGLCGYVCHHPCEKACLRGSWDAPVSIRELKRYAVQYEMEHREEILGVLRARMQAARGKNAIVVGAGPAGLACAYELIMAGCEVRVLDALDRPGGMLVGGIPPFRLPRWVIDHDVGMIRSLGVEFVPNLSLGKDFTLQKLKEEGADAVILATGAWQDQGLGIPGEETQGMMTCLDFLGKANAGKQEPLHGRVLVIGGGNAAVDTARSALRLGADEVVILYRRTREEMPAIEEEVEEALKEGVQIRFLLGPKQVVSRNGRVAGVEMLRMELGAPDESGRKRPVPVEGSAFVEPASTVITAVGQRPDTSFLKGEGVSGKKVLECDASGMVMGHEAVFAAGDALSGPSTVVEATASGKRAARRVMDYLEGGNGTC